MAEEKVSVMIIDDSVFMRSAVCAALKQEDGIEIIAQASNGRLALPRVRHFKPDVVLLDQNMPEMNGLDTLPRILEESPDSKVMMFSALTVEGAQITLEAMRKGAVDFFAKPERYDETDFDGFVKRRMIPKILEIGKLRLHSRTHEEIRTPVKFLPIQHGSCDLCAIGISTGGPNALRELIPLLPKKLNGAILIAQHMPQHFTRVMAENLDGHSALTVSEARNGERIENGHVYIAPGGRHLRVKEQTDGLFLQVTDEEPELNCRPSVNILFESLAQIQNPGRVLALIMTGMGNDGTRGMRLLKAAGAHLAAQSKESCLVFGMPADPIREGLVSHTGDITELSQLIQKYMEVRTND